MNEGMDGWWAQRNVDTEQVKAALKAQQEQQIDKVRYVCEVGVFSFSRIY